MMATDLERHRSMDEGQVLELALACARHGWRVAPLYELLPDGRCSCERKECHEVGRHMRLPDARCATTDEEQIRRWWRMAPRAGIGVVMATGVAGSAGCADAERATIVPIPGTLR
jgi:hypothetical protein